MANSVVVTCSGYGGGAVIPVAAFPEVLRQFILTLPNGFGSRFHTPAPNEVRKMWLPQIASDTDKTALTDDVLLQYYEDAMMLLKMWLRSDVEPLTIKHPLTLTTVVPKIEQLSVADNTVFVPDGDFKASPFTDYWERPLPKGAVLAAFVDIDW